MITSMHVALRKKSITLQKKSGPACEIRLFFSVFLAFRSHLNYLSFFKWQLFFCSIRIGGHGQWIVVKESNKYSSRNVLCARICLWFFINIWRKTVPAAVAICGSKLIEEKQFSTSRERHFPTCSNLGFKVVPLSLTDLFKNCNVFPTRCFP